MVGKPMREIIFQNVGNHSSEVAVEGYMPEYTFFYARISTDDQNLDRQLKMAEELGIPQKRVYADIASGKDFSRENYQRLLESLREGDTVVISSIDRLGRNYRETSEAWEKITKEIGANIEVLDMPIINSKVDDPTSQLVGDIVVMLLTYVADRERQNIRQRQYEGIQAAKARGAYKGRQPVKLDKAKFLKLYIEVKNHERTSSYAAEKLGISKATYHRICKEYETHTGRFAVDNDDVTK